MSRALPPEGDHIGEVVGRLEIIEEKSGSIGVKIPYRLPDINPVWQDVHVVYIVSKDGTVIANGIQNLKKVFGWDGFDPFALVSGEDGNKTDSKDWTGTRFKAAQCVHEEYSPEGGDKTYTNFKIGFFNPVDGGGREFKPADPKQVMAKFGAKFRALAGGTPQKPASKPAPKSQSLPAGEPCSMEDAYAVHVTKNPGKSEEELSGLWWKKIGEVFPDVPEDKQDKLTKEQYGRLRAALS